MHRNQKFVTLQLLLCQQSPKRQNLRDVVRTILIITTTTFISECPHIYDPSSALTSGVVLTLEATVLPFPAPPSSFASASLSLLSVSGSCASSRKCTFSGHAGCEITLACSKKTRPRSESSFGSEICSNAETSQFVSIDGEVNRTTVLLPCLYRFAKRWCCLW